MAELNTNKLFVEFRSGTTATEPIIPRRYTLTHSDITAELFLTIGPTYAYDKISAMRDEVLGEWVANDKMYLYHVYLYIDGQFGYENAAKRNIVFRRELPLALQAIRYGDRVFFTSHPGLDYVPIQVHFLSTIPQYNKVEYWGTFSDYNINKSMNDRSLLDFKVGDVTGDGIPDEVALYGRKPEGPSSLYADNITIVIKDGRTGITKSITPEFNAGYNARLFLGDFTKDKVDDIKLSIDSGGSGGYGFFYIYSYKNNILREIFNFNLYNNEFTFKVEYENFYRVSVSNVMLNKLFILDISYKGSEYLSQYYDDNGILKKPVQGEVLALSSLFPIVIDEKTNYYDLLAIQRIIGTTDSDTLGYVTNVLSWNGERFVSIDIFVAIPGTNLISPYKK